MSGPIRWPTHCRDSGEGGLYVFAFVKKEDYAEDDECCGPNGTIALPLPDAVLNDPGRIYDRGRADWRRRIDSTLNTMPHGDGVYTSQQVRDFMMAEASRVYATMSTGENVVAAVQLGTSYGSWWDEGRGDYWQCTLNDLEPAGLAVVEALQVMYQAPVHLTTYLDT